MSETKITETKITQIGTVIVSVADQDEALAFYCGTLGFEKRMDVPFGRGDRWIEVAPPGASTTIALAVPPEGAEGGGMEVAYSTDDADADHAALRAAGVDVDDEVMRWGDPVPPMFTFRDRDGNAFRVVERPREG